MLSSFRNVSVIDDLPQNTVQAMVQDREGFLWIGSESGLLRYDGRIFEKYTAGYNRNFFLCDNSINTLAQDPKQHIWVATTEGVSAFNPYGTLSQNAPLTSLTAAINKKTGKQSANCFHFTNDHTVYIGHHFGVSVVNIKTREVTFYPELSINGRKESTDIVKIGENAGQLLLLSQKRGLLRGNFKQGFTSIIPDPGAGITYTSFIRLSGDHYLMATNTGLMQVRKTPKGNRTDWQYHFIKETAGKMMTILQMDVQRNRILAGTEANGFYILDTACRVQEQVKRGNTPKTLIDNYVVSVLTDKNGDGYWIGTNHGLCRFFFRENAFSTISFYDQKGSPNKVYPVYTENNRELFVGTLDGLFRIDLHTVPVPRLIKNTENIHFYSIAKSGPAYYLLGTARGIFETVNGWSSIRNASVANKELAFADSSKIYCIFPLNDNEVLFAYRNDTACGIIRWNRAQHAVSVCRPNTTVPLSSKNKISNILKAGPDKVIICNNEGVVYYYPATNTFKDLALPGPGSLNYAQVSDAIFDSGQVWIATYGGGINVIDLKTNRFRYITEKKGLANNDLYSIHKTAQNRYWVSSNRGIGYFNPDNGQFINYTKNNGLLDNEYDRLSSFRCGDTLYFGGLSGLVFFNYKMLQQQSPAPPVFISRIRTLENGKENELLPPENGQLRISQKQSNLRILLSFPSYVFPENNRFFYRVLPGDTNWLDMGNSNTLLLSGLPPGKYTIEAKAISSTGSWSSQHAALQLFIKPRWFQALWFKILLIMVLAGIIILIYKARIYHIQKEYTIKKEISKDLHDDLGGTLSSIRLFSQLAVNENAGGPGLEKIKDAANEAVLGLKNLIWTLDDDKNTLSDLTDRLQQFCAPLFELNHVDFSIRAAVPLRQAVLKKSEKKELFMILKEAVVNCLKHARCQHASLEIDGQPASLVFRFSDDGIGFSSTEEACGYGLKNMRTRAAQVGYQVHLLSAKGSGTCITIERKR